MASGDLEGYWKHLAPEPGCETYHCLQKSNPILRKEFRSESNTHLLRSSAEATGCWQGLMRTSLP